MCNPFLEILNKINSNFIYNLREDIPNSNDTLSVISEKHKNVVFVISEYLLNLNLIKLINYFNEENSSNSNLYILNIDKLLKSQQATYFLFIFFITLLKANFVNFNDNCDKIYLSTLDINSENLKIKDLLNKFSSLKNNENNSYIGNYIYFPPNSLKTLFIIDMEIDGLIQNLLSFKFFVNKKKYLLIERKKLNGEISNIIEYLDIIDSEKIISISKINKFKYLDLFYLIENYDYNNSYEEISTSCSDPRFGGDSFCTQ